MAANDFYRPFAQALGAPVETRDDDLNSEIMHRVWDIRKDAESQQEHLDKEVAQLVGRLRLPLSDALSVPDEEVAAVSREALEKIAQLKMEADEAWNEFESKINEAASQLPEDQKKEAIAFVSFT